MTFYRAVISVDKVKRHIQRNKDKIDNIQSQYIIYVASCNFSQDTANVTDDNRNHKYKAFSLCGFGCKAFVNGDWPGKTKAYKHYKFKNLCHKLIPSFSFFYILLLTNLKVKYIILIEIIRNTYE